jgi:hypothetical protein
MTRIVVFNLSGWQLLEADDFGDVSALLFRSTFEDLLRDAVVLGYIRSPVAIKLGEVPISTQHSEPLR